MTDIDKDFLSSQFARRFDAIELVVGGVNRTYWVREGTTVFYLRLYRQSGRPLPQIIAETSLLMRFPDSAPVGVSRPTAKVDGTCIIEMVWNSEKRHACLFESTEGAQIEFNPAHMERFGASIANLHLAMPAIVDGEVRELDPVALVRDALHALQRVPQSKEVMDVIERRYLPSLVQLDLRALPVGMCHGDAWTGNARLQDDRTVFFDFDDFERGPLVLDLSTALWHFAHEVSPENDAMVEALITGYRQVRPLSGPERNALDLFIRLNEVRSLLFLARYCALSDEVWSKTFERAITVLSQSQISPRLS
ncbi:phosphotransferase enzyme family protein [Pseudochelatococcus sp. B33]